MGAVQLSVVDLVIAALLILANAGLSFTFRLGLERSLAIAALRMVAQLALAGLILKFVFDAATPWITVAVGAVMLGFAGFEVWSRQSRSLGLIKTLSLGTGTLLLIGTLATLLAVGGLIGPEPWTSPRYILPVFGMVLGNALTAVALVLDTLTNEVIRDRPAIEARLALGQNRHEALSVPVRRALKVGTMPIINAMAVCGVVSLPGMMTGQILAGADPVEAAKYQIMIMFVLAGASALAALVTVLGGVYLLTDRRHRLRLDRLGAERSGSWPFRRDDRGSS